jgi:phage FluMu protein Com
MNNIIKIKCPHCNEIFDIDLNSEIDKSNLLLDSDTNEKGVAFIIDEIQFGIVDQNGGDKHG